MNHKKTLEEEFSFPILTTSKVLTYNKIEDEMNKNNLDNYYLETIYSPGEIAVLKFDDDTQYNIQNAWFYNLTQILNSLNKLGDENLVIFPKSLKKEYFFDGGIINYYFGSPYLNSNGIIESNFDFELHEPNIDFENFFESYIYSYKHINGFTHLKITFRLVSKNNFFNKEFSSEKNKTSYKIEVENIFDESFIKRNEKNIFEFKGRSDLRNLKPFFEFKNNKWIKGNFSSYILTITSNDENLEIKDILDIVSSL